MSKLSYAPAPNAKSVSPSMLQRNSFMADVFTVSGLFPSSKEAWVDNCLVRQHLLQETRQQTRDIIDNDPVFRQLYVRHCSSNTPAGSRHIGARKRILPPRAYINVEPHKSMSDDTIDCVHSVTSLAALNTNDRITTGRSMVFHQSRLLQVDKDELKTSEGEKVKMYKAPPETFRISKMKEAVENLYSLEVEMPFMKALNEQSRAKKLEKSNNTPTEKPQKEDTIPKTEPTQRTYVKKRAFFPLLKKEHEKAKQKDAGPASRPYIMGFFLGKSRTAPTGNVVKNEEFSITGQTLKHMLGNSCQDLTI